MSNAYVRLSRGELIARLKLCEGSGAAISRSHGGNHEPARAALADSEERLRAILETAVEGIITINERGVIEDVNPAACKLFDYVREELTGRNVKSLMPAPYRAEHDGYLSNYRDTGHAKIIGIGREVVGQRRDGSTFPMELSVAEVDLASGRRFVGFVRDISARKESEQRTLAALKELTDIKAALDEHSIVAVTDSAGRITHVNEKFCLLSKYSRAELIGKDHRIINSRHHTKEFFRNLWTTIARGKVWRGEIKNRAKDGSHYWVDTTIFPFLNHHGKPTQYIAIRTDITERKAHEEKLIKFADLQAALRASEREVLAVTERERARFGGELHDGLGQQLTAIELMCRSLKEDLQDSRPELEKQVAQICQYLREAISQTRSLARGLAPVEVEGAGLAEALQELARRTHELGKSKCHFICSAAVPVADNNVAGHLYRIAQEAVNNALKHAHASEITISLMHQRGSVRLEIADDGKGLPKRPKAGGGIGLRVMKHRASVTEGDLEVVSAAGKGTRIICTLRKKQP